MTVYLSHIQIDSFRTFQHAGVDFVHADQDFAALGLPRPKLPNLNLLLGSNGAGKTTLLRAVAIAALGPAAGSAGLPVRGLIRRSPGGAGPTQASLRARFATHPQDRLAEDDVPQLESQVTIQRKGDIELLDWTGGDDGPWQPIYSNDSEALFFVGYGATRRVETREVVDPGARQTSSLARSQRVRGLFEEAYSLIPLSAWLTELAATNKGRFVQVQHLLDRLLEGTGYRFTGGRAEGEYLFSHEGLEVPFTALSDGYRAYLGWIGDLLYHVCATCPSGKKLVDNHGLVMVDEIDLHLHPRWQMSVLPTLSVALPKLQFIVTSHSPLVVGSLEWMNVLVMAPTEEQASAPVRVPAPIHGLDADQLLLTELFGLESTRAPGKQKQLAELSARAQQGDDEAARRLLEELARGTEAAG